MQWVELKKKFPKENELVLVYDNKRFYVACWIRHPTDNERKMWKGPYPHEPITYWMRIKLPKHEKGFVPRINIRQKFENGEYNKKV